MKISSWFLIITAGVMLCGTPSFAFDWQDLLGGRHEGNGQGRKEIVDTARVVEDNAAYLKRWAQDRSHYDRDRRIKEDMMARFNELAGQAQRFRQDAQSERVNGRELQNSYNDLSIAWGRAHEFFPAVNDDSRASKAFRRIEDNMSRLPDLIGRGGPGWDSRHGQQDRDNQGQDYHRY